MTAHWATAAVQTAVSGILDFIFPPLCVVCDAPRAPHTVWLCAKCLDRLRENNRSRNACSRCGQNQTLRRCACEFAWDHPFDSIHSLFDYDDTVRRIVHQIKYQGRKSLAFDMGRLFGELLPLSTMQESLWIPVPLHFLRRFKRGYNQAEWFARGILRTNKDIPQLCTGSLVRSRSTRTQTKLDRSRRQKNLSGAFRVVPGFADTIRGRDVILVDDVVTTGATAAICAQTLRDAGCRSVRIVSLARD